MAMHHLINPLYGWWTWSSGQRMKEETSGVFTSLQVLTTLLVSTLSFLESSSSHHATARLACTCVSTEGPQTDLHVWKTVCSQVTANLLWQKVVGLWLAAFWPQRVNWGWETTSITEVNSFVRHINQGESVCTHAWIEREIGFLKFLSTPPISSTVSAWRGWGKTAVTVCEITPMVLMS